MAEKSREFHPLLLFIMLCWLGWFFFSLFIKAIKIFIYFIHQIGN